MKILACDFLKTIKGYNVGMCMISNEGGNRIKHSEVFERDCKLEDIAGFIINKFKLLKCDYVVIDSFGLGVVVNDILKDKLGDKVKIYNSCALEQNKIIEILSKSKILEELGLELKCCIFDIGLYKFDRKEYTDFEYLMVKSIGMANKLLNEIEEDKLMNTKVALGDINIKVECNTDILIEDLAKEISGMVSNVYKEIANDYCDKFKDNKNDINNKIDDVLKRLTIKENNKLSMTSVLRDNLNYYEKIGRTDLCETCKKELKNINAENEFIYNLIIDIEKIKNMIDEIK